MNQRYISRELTHFVGRSLKTEEDKYALLADIIRSGLLTWPPHPPEKLGISMLVALEKKWSRNELYYPPVVCFCDIPLADLGIHMAKYSRFGLSFLKPLLISRGATPVFYVSRNSRQFDTSLGDLFDRMMSKWHDVTKSRRDQQQAPSQPLRDFIQLVEFHLFSFVKFFDPEKSDDDPENTYMEREWRILGHLNFELSEIHRIIIPHTYGKRLRDDFPNYTGQITYTEHL